MQISIKLKRRIKKQIKILLTAFAEQYKLLLFPILFGS